LHGVAGKGKEVKDQRCVVGADVAGERSGIRLYLDDRVASDGVEHVTGKAHVDHFLQRDGEEAFLRGGIRASADGVKGV
jgi:hypothetical protein